MRRSRHRPSGAALCPCPYDRSGAGRGGFSSDGADAGAAADRTLCRRAAVRQIWSIAALDLSDEGSRGDVARAGAQPASNSPARPHHTAVPSISVAHTSSIPAIATSLSSSLSGWSCKAGCATRPTATTSVRVYIPGARRRDPPRRLSEEVVPGRGIVGPPLTNDLRSSSGRFRGWHASVPPADGYDLAHGAQRDNEAHL